MRKPPSRQALLLEDGGATAASEDSFFRCPQFLAAEEIRHSLVIIDDAVELAIPVKVHPVPDSEYLDATSPYGYPGGSRSRGEPFSAAEVDWSKTGLVSLFVRDRLHKAPTFTGGTKRSEVYLVDSVDDIQKRIAGQVRANARRGWKTRILSGNEIGAEELAAYELAYRETMERRDAAERYRYGTSYFATLLGSEHASLVLASKNGETPASGAILVESDGAYHYYLGGTRDDAYDESPMKNVFHSMIEEAATTGKPLNLGGGVTPGDSLEDIKRRLSGRVIDFITHGIICDADAYADLAGDIDAEGFFPAYRATARSLD